MTATIFTHNGCITLENPKTGKHRTFKISTVKKGKLAGKRIVSMLIGPDNEEDYLGIGFVNESSIYVWRDYQGTDFEKTVKCLLEVEKRGLIQHFETCCRRCGRKLTTPESITSGIGPECSKKEQNN